MWNTYIRFYFIPIIRIDFSVIHVLLQELNSISNQ